jgi:hypothetical protein
MKYTVVLSPVAEHQLAEAWLQAPDKMRVTHAFDRIEKLLKEDAHLLGRVHPSGWRVIGIWPIGVTFQVSDDDRLVTIKSVFYRP